MLRKLPPLHALAAFECVARHQSFAKAAEELCLTSSAVSYRIRQLETSLGSRLFVRTSRNVVLTAAGAAFLEIVRESLDRLERASARLGAEGRPTLRVSPSPLVASNWLGYRIGDFFARHPDIELEVHTSPQLMDLRGDTDVAIRYGAGAWPGLHCVKLLPEDVFPVCSPEYLERIGPIRAPEDLRRAQLLRTPYLSWRDWFRAAGAEWEGPSSGPLFREILLLHQACVNGAGIGLAGSVMIDPALRAGKVVRLLEAAIPEPHAYWAVCTPERLGRPEVARFVDWLEEKARETRAAMRASAPARAGESPPVC